MSEKGFKEKVKDFGDQVKSSVNAAGDKLKEMNRDCQLKWDTKKAFEEKAVKFELVGKKNVLGSALYIYGVTNFRLLSKEVYFREEDVEGAVYLGTLLKDGDKTYAIKDIFKGVNEYVDLEVKTQVNGEEVFEDVKVPCFKAILKSVK